MVWKLHLELWKLSLKCADFPTVRRNPQSRGYAEQTMIKRCQVAGNNFSELHWHVNSFWGSLKRKVFWFCLTTSLPLSISDAFYWSKIGHTEKYLKDILKSWDMGRFCPVNTERFDIGTKKWKLKRLFIACICLAAGMPPNRESSLLSAGFENWRKNFNIFMELGISLSLSISHLLSSLNPTVKTELTPGF